MQNYQDIIKNKADLLIKDFLAHHQAENFKNFKGYAGAELVYKWFENNTNHPHALYTFEQESLNRDMSLDNTCVFAKYLANKMARLVATNEMITESNNQD